MTQPSEGTIVKKGNKIYAVDKYDGEETELDAKEWEQHVGRKVNIEYVRGDVILDLQQ